MAKKRATSGLDTKLKKALAGHARDETTYNTEYIDLPPGIIGGIARLVEAKIGEYAKGDNVGQKFVYLAGVVVEPKEVTFAPQTFVDGRVVNLPVQTVTVEGQRTSVMFPLCDTKNRKGEVTEVDVHVENMENELRKLGGPEITEDIGDTESLTEALETLKTAEPLFKFGTSSSSPTAEFPKARTWENWFGSKGLEDYEPEESAAVDDASGDGEVEPNPEEAETEDDLDALAEAADDDADAAKRLTAIAKEAGIDAEEIETWAEVVGMIQAAGHAVVDDEEEGEEEEEEEEEEPADDPVEDDVWEYTAKGAEGPSDFLVTAVDTKKKTVTIKSLENPKKVIRNVPWSKLG